MIAFFAILFTTRYPKGLFDFNVGVIRWSWRVSFYGYAALGTDRYPPFTLADVPDYPARLDLEYPQQLNRWLPLVKWLLAFPQYILVGALVGSGYVVATSMQDGRAVTYSTPSLIGAAVLIAAIAMLFTTRYPPGLFDLALGIDRWGYRLLVYVALMTDRYHPEPARMLASSRSGLTSSKQALSLQAMCIECMERTGIRNWPWPASLPAADEIRLSPLARWVLGVDGSLALIQGLVMFVAPGRILLAVASAALSCRVIGAVFCMGGAGPPGFHRSQVEHGQAVVASRNDHGDSHPRCGVPRRARIRSPTRG